MHPDPHPHCTTRRQFIAHGGASTLGFLALAAGQPSWAQTPIAALQILCGAAAGSTPDIVARRVAEQLTGQHAQRAIVDNRPGAAGRIAVHALKMAPTDGSTMLLAAGSISTLVPLLFTTPGYDPDVDLQPVSLAAELPLALAVGAAVPDSVGNVRELLEWMRRNPALANVGSPGVGSLPHLLETILFRRGDVAWQHIAYSGGAPAVVALLGGQIAAVALPEAVLSPHRASGRLRVLATSGARRSRFMADVPNLVEMGYADLIVLEWFALYMAAQVPGATVDAASLAVRQAIARPELTAAFAALGMVAVSSTPAELKTRIAAERRTWEPIVRAAQIRIE